MKNTRIKLGSTLALSLLVISNPASANNETCAIVTDTDTSLGAAIQEFEQACPGQTRQDCDPVGDGRWMCSTDNITSTTPIISTSPPPLPSPVPAPAPLPDPEPEPSTDPIVATDGACEAQGSSLTEAINAYGRNCPGVPRKDCDPIGDGDWICSSETIGESAPGSVAGGDTPAPEVPTPDEPEPTEPAPTPDEPEPNEPSPTPNEPEPDEPTQEPADEPAPEETDHTYAKNDGPYKNPLKGWNSGWDGDNNHPESSVGFQYIPWKEFEPLDGSFDRQAVENIIAREGSKNRHLILRLYCDWHGNEATSDCPAWMYIDAGVARLRGNNGRYITDFNDPAYVRQAQDAIKALANAYDNDPRIYAVQMGVIGYWGEWHSWGSAFNGGSYEITDGTKNAVLSAYKSSFGNAKIMARYPWREPTQSAGGIGFHNDYFVANNGHSEEFDNAIATGSQWINNPIGGEVPPRGNGEANSEKSVLFNNGSGQAILETGHYSTMKAGAYRVTEGQSGYAGYMRLHKKMGYNYQIDTARFSDTTPGSAPFSAEVIGTNIGVAPMYFDWEVQFALLDGNDQPVVTENADSDLTAILPGMSFTFSSSLALNSVDSGSYRLAIRIIQPNADKPKSKAWKLDARNTYILFSNDLPTVNGKWTNNVLKGGWSVLGNVSVQ